MTNHDPRRALLATLIANARGHAQSAEAVAAGIEAQIEAITGRPADEDKVADVIWSGRDIDDFLDEVLPPKGPVQ